MLPVGLWRREALELRSQRGPLVRGMLVPLAIALPLLGGNPPAFHEAAAYTTLLALTGALAAGRRAAGLMAEGIPTRLLATPASPYRLFADALAVQVCLDFVRALPLLVAIAARHHSSAAGFAALLASAVPALVFATLAGAAAGGLAGSRAEVPVYALVGLLPALFVAGAYTPPDELAAWRVALAGALPLSGLREAMQAVTTGTPPPPLARCAGLSCATAAAWTALALLELRRRLRGME
ncbi:MAG: hypothetical protein HZB25_06810 [Candidatus Eisenbacteria bacterium]|nr:hypothetical protein [Candidatus Eisenbacteria bacterium]